MIAKKERKKRALKEVKRDERIYIRVSSDEKELLKNLAYKQGGTVSDYLRDAAMSTGAGAASLDKRP